MPKASVISIILLSFSLITIVFAFSSYWYYDKTKINGRVIYENFFDYDKYKMLKVNVNNSVPISTTLSSSSSSTSTPSSTTSNSITITTIYYDKEYEYNNRNYLAIFRTCLGFACVSFITIFSTLVYLFYQTLRKSHHPPHRYHQYIKIVFKLIILFGVLCSGLSIFIFIGVNDEKKKDCQRNYSKHLCGNINTKFTYSYSYIDNSSTDHSGNSSNTDSYHYYAGPYLSWYMMVGSSIFSLISVFIIFMGDAFDTSRLSYTAIDN